MSKKQPLSACDMTIQTERGFRERFVCSSEEDFRVRAYQYCANIWKSKSERMRDRLLDDLRVLLKKFSMGGTCSFELCGLVIMPSVHFASE